MVFSRKLTFAGGLKNEWEVRTGKLGVEWGQVGFKGSGMCCEKSPGREWQV